MSNDLDQHRTAISAVRDELRTLAESARLLTAELTGRRPWAGGDPRRRRLSGEHADVQPGHRSGQPLSPPLRVSPTDDGLLGHCILGIAHEVPPDYTDGGMSAMIFDEPIGRACGEKGLPAMTVSLAVAYHRPVRLQRALVARAQVAQVHDRTIHVTGSVAEQATQDHALVAADGVFVALTRHWSGCCSLN
jgi:hypothetical protein